MIITSPAFTPVIYFAINPSPIMPPSSKSMEKDFQDFGLTVEEVEKILTKRLIQTFSEHKYKVFDVKLYERPRQRTEADDLNWGGYRVEFKVIDYETYQRIGDDIDSLRKQSIRKGV